MLVYPSGIDVSSSTVALAHRRNGHPYAQLADGFGVGTTIAYRNSPRPSMSWPSSPPASPTRSAERR